MIMIVMKKDACRKRSRLNVELMKAGRLSNGGLAKLLIRVLADFDKS